MLDHLNTAMDIIKTNVDNNKIPGAIVAICDKNNYVCDCYGYKQIVPIKQALTIDTIYDIASLSKVVSTSTMILKMIEDGVISLNTKVSDILKDFPYHQITIEHLMTHTSGIIGDDKAYKTCKNKEELYEFICHLPLAYETGTSVEYSCFGFILLGKIIEHFYLSIDDYANKVVFRPLKTTKMMYRPKDKGYQNLCAPTEYSDTRGLIQADIHDGKAFILEGLAGNAGVFSDIDSLARFVMMMLNNGIYDNNILLKPNTIELLKKSYTGGLNELRTLGGWYINDKNTSAGKYITEVSLYHTGFTGTSIYIDYCRNIGIIILANSVHPKRNGEMIKIRKDIHNSILKKYAF